MNADTTTKKLACRLSLPLLVFYGVGTILGAGIYVLTGKVATAAGSFATAAFMMSALIVSFSAYSYAKLSSRFPFSAGEAVYVREAFGSERLASAVGWAIVLTGVVSAATISRGFAGYLSLFVSLPHSVGVTLVVLTLTIIACRGVLEAVGVAVLKFALWLPITRLAKLTSAIMLLVFALVNAALLAVEWQTRGSGKAWLRLAALAIPALGLTLCLMFPLIQVV